jgi:lipoprotein
MKTSFITALLAAAALLAGCSKDAPDGGPQPSDGNRVVFTLGGATRAAGDNDASAQLAATDEEKKIDGLLAVAFTDDGNYYKTFDAAYDADSQTASFDVEKNGTYDIWFVANADETLAAALLALTDRNSDSRVTEDDLAALLVTQQVGRKDGEEAWYPFVMFSTEARRIVSKHGVVTNGGIVTMRRLAVRIDLVNAATGVTVNSVKFVNRTKQSRLGASNDMTFSTPQDLYEEKSYEGIDLAGDFAKPTEYKASIYSYENVDVTPDGEHLPALEVKYTMDGLKFTHTVKFFDSTDPAGKTPLALKRNYLYRIVLTKQLDVSFDITVEDWNTAGAFQIEDIPFDKHDQAALNAALKVNMFTEFNVKSVDLNSKTVNAFFDKLAVSADECPTDSYFTYTQLKDAGATAADAVFTGPDGKKYRLPTAGELNLLLPMYTEPGDQPDIDGKKGQYCPWWNDNASTNTSLVTVETPFTETIYLKNGEDNLPDKSHPDDTDSEYTLKGQSQMKLGVLSETVHYYTTEPDDPQKGNYNIHPVYAVRFKGTSQYAAYRWESCRIADDPLERYFSIKIKALPADSELTVDDVADNVSFWRDGFIEFKFPASGYYAPEIGQPTPENITYRGVNGYCRSSSLWTGGSHVYDLRFSLNNAHMDHSALDNKYSLRLVKVSE